MENTELYDHIQLNVESCLSRHPDALVMVTGDFNPISTGFDGKRLKRLSGLRQIINVPTRNDAILDWCLVNLKEQIILSQQRPPIGSSDHNAILVRPYVQLSTKRDNKNILKRDLPDSSLRSFGRWITTYDWKDVYETVDCDRKFNKFNEILSSMVNYFCPVKVRSSDKPWMTLSLKLYLKKRQMAFHEYGKNSYAYKYWRNKVQYKVKQARKTYYRNSVDKLKNTNPAKWWKEIKSIGSLSSQVNWHSQLLSETTPACSDIPEYYNEYLVGLTSHFNTLQDRNPTLNLSVPSHLLVSTDSVLVALQRIKLSKSCGPDLIPNKILKTFAFEQAPVVCNIYNTSIRQGIFPHHLKRSFVVPIPKSSPPASIEDDLRPISLTSQIAKVMEEFTLRSLMVEIQDKIYVKQFAMPGKSTTQALVYLLHIILAALDTGHCFIRLVFADFRKGFDLVDHNRIIDELENLNVFVRWIRSFLTNREQCVKISRCISSWKTVASRRERNLDLYCSLSWLTHC